MGEYKDMKKLTYIPIIGIAIGEFLIFYNKILAGIGIHIISLLAIILIIICGNLSLKTKDILQSLILLPLLRIISISIPSIPQLSEKIYAQHLITYGIMLIPIYLIMKNRHILHKESETNQSILLYDSRSFKRVYIYIPTVMLAIIIIGFIGQYAGIIPNTRTLSPEVSDVIGEFVTMFMIAIISISLLVTDTKYCNEYISSIINIYSSPLLLVFITIVIQKIMTTL